MKRVLIGALAVVVGLVALAYGGTAVMGVVSPATMVRIQTAEPSQWGKAFASRTVAAPETVRELAAGEPAATEVDWKGSPTSVRDFLAETDAVAFVVLRDGKVADEWYADGVDASTRMSSWSMAKSIVSLLVGRAIGAGELSEDDRLVDLVPELRTGGEYDQITVRHLLDMTSGVDVPEDYNEYWPFTGTARMYITTDLPGFLADHRDLTSQPGERGDYLSVNTALLGLVLERVTGQHLADLLSRDLWKPMGAGDDATWNLDHAGGTEKAFCCINATALDFARVGQVVLDRGRVDDRQVIPAAWIDRIATPAPLPVADWGYSAQWWHPPGSDRGDYAAIGIYGQYIYVDPRSKTVIVKLSNYGTEQDEQATIDAFRSLTRDR